MRPFVTIGMRCRGAFGKVRSKMYRHGFMDNSSPQRLRELVWMPPLRDGHDLILTMVVESEQALRDKIAVAAK